MSTSSRGNTLETRIFDLLEAEILAGRFLTTPDRCKVFRKKGYYSKDREKEIIFDISIEISLPGASNYSILVVVECKNYGHSVPVDDAEEFFAKLQQVSGANIKGIIASTGCFQEGTFNFSKSKGIGLLRYFDSGDFKWMLHRSPSTFNIPLSREDRFTVHRGLTLDTYRSRHFDFFGYVSDHYTSSLPVLFEHILLETAKGDSLLANLELRKARQQRVVNFLSQEQLERVSHALLDDVGYSGGPVPLDVICEDQSIANGLVLKTGLPACGRDLADGILGRIRFDPPEITIYHYPNGKDTWRRFTLAHELGHYILDHGRFISSEFYDQNDFDKQSPQLGIHDLRRIEWQANYFASCLLLPRSKFVKDFLLLADANGLHDRGFGILFVDDQRCNEENYRRITDALKLEYSVSRAVIKHRLTKLGLLNDRRGLRPVGAMDMDSGRRR